MAFNDLLKKLFGNKSQRDLKEIDPYIAKIKAISPTLENISNDELRGRIDVIKQSLRDRVAPDREQVAELKKQVEDMDYDKREAVWEEVDKIEKHILEKLEEGLDEALPEAFALERDCTAVLDKRNDRSKLATQFVRELVHQTRFRAYRW